ncbi:glycosyltransferase [Desertivirga xinjiangensis]|uniref:glycosyltransferase n=1 Tax=Desertivirga xinjiangensis TaxID=539206 RepID=UPI0021093F2D|nr:glycosyltransferase [Pedobacter xinjiangensis]
MADYLYITVFALFQLAFFLQLYYIIVVHRNLRNYKAKEKSPMERPVSIIVCARNEERNLEKNLSYILEQEYPDFEVIVVNDCSVDESDLLLRRFSQKYSHLKVVTITEHVRFKHGKKFAVTLGIKAAKYEHLLFTDADCCPASMNWLKQMQQNFSDSTEIVLGYSPYNSTPGILNKLIRYETFFTALNYLSYTLAGKPYMGVGRNMAYTKSLFFRGKGFASHMHIPSGDDDLFVNQNANSLNTVIEIHPETHVWTEPKATFRSYLSQKIRHMGAGKAYKAEHKRMLSFQAGSGIAFYVLLVLLLLLNAQWYVISSFYCIRLLAQVVIYYPVFKRLSYKDLIWWLPALDLIYNFYILVLSIISSFRKTVKWK